MWRVRVAFQQTNFRPLSWVRTVCPPGEVRRVALIWIRRLLFCLKDGGAACSDRAGVQRQTLTSGAQPHNLAPIDPSIGPIRYSLARKGSTMKLCTYETGNGPRAG